MISNLSVRLQQVIIDTISGLRAEVSIISLFIFILFLDLFLNNKENKKTLFFTNLFGLFIVLLFNYLDFINPLNSRLLNDFLVITKPISFLKLCLGICYVLSSLILIQSSEKYQKAETYLLLNASYLGLSLVLMSANWISLILSLEIASLSFYVLVGFDNDKKSTEASMKYLIIGLLATAIMIYGVSILYGTIGTMNFTEPNFVSKIIHANSFMPFIGLLFISLGLLFKLGLFPMHIWIPDTYQGISWFVISIISTAPKIAVTGVFLFFWNKILLIQFQFGNIEFTLLHFVILVIIVSILIGSFSAINQQNLKRFIGYSSIANLGFVLLGFVANSNAGTKASLYYIISYSLILFGLIFIFSVLNFDKINDFKGLSIKNSSYAVLITIFLLAFSGIPPSIGFNSKLLIFTSIIGSLSKLKELNESIFYFSTILITFSFLSTLIGFYYYLKIPYFMFLKNVENEYLNTISFTKLSGIFSSIIAILTIGLFFINIVN